MTTTSAAEATAPAPPVGYQLSVDTGGTFTDGFVTSGDRSAQVKVDSRPDDPTEGFAACVGAAAEAVGESLPSFLAKAKLVHFSSTIATNIVVQRSGAQVGLIVTAGSEHTLYGSTEDAGRLSGFVDLANVRGVGEGTGPDGAITQSVDPDSLQAAVRELLEQGVHLLVVSFARAHLNPANEVSARALIEASYPRHYLGAIPLLLSSQLSLHPDDHGRTALAVASAYLHPTLARSLYKAEDRLREQGFRRPLLVVNTDGSSTRVAKTQAIDTFNSGPSAGVLGAAIVARALAAQHVVTFDVGGTTTDVAHIASAQPPQADTTAFGNVSVPHPAIALWSFGLGGGSIISARTLGAPSSAGQAADESAAADLTVGPQSAGAVPGPACFGLGGNQPTPTDVWLTLGYLEPAEFLSGHRKLDPGGARAALSPLADKLGTDVDGAALAALDAIHTALAGHLQAWAALDPDLSSSDPADRWLFSYGGGGGLLAVPAAAALGIGQVVVFPQSSVFSAFGGSLLPIAHTYHAVAEDVSDADTVTGTLTRMLDRAARDMRAEGVPAGDGVLATASLQDFAEHQASTAAPLAQMLADPASAGLTLSGSGRRGRLSLSIRATAQQRLRITGASTVSKATTYRRVRFPDGIKDVPVAAGLGCPQARPVTGPAFLAASDTTVFLPAGWTAEFNSLGYGIVRRQRGNG